VFIRFWRPSAPQSILRFVKTPNRDQTPWGDASIATTLVDLRTAPELEQLCKPAELERILVLAEEYGHRPGRTTFASCRARTELAKAWLVEIWLDPKVGCVDEPDGRAIAPAREASSAWQRTLTPIFSSFNKDNIRSTCSERHLGAHVFKILKLLGENGDASCVPRFESHVFRSLGKWEVLDHSQNKRGWHCGNPETSWTVEP